MKIQNARIPLFFLITVGLYTTGLFSCDDSKKMLVPESARDRNEQFCLNRWLEAVLHNQIARNRRLPIRIQQILYQRFQEKAQVEMEALQEKQAKYRRRVQGVLEDRIAVVEGLSLHCPQASNMIQDALTKGKELLGDLEAIRNDAISQRFGAFAYSLPDVQPQQKTKNRCAAVRQRV